MSLRDLLVFADQSQRAPERLRLAAELARRHQSRLTVLYVRELSPAQRHEQRTAELGQASAAAITRTNKHIQQSIDAAEARCRAAMDDVQRAFGLQVEWLCLTGVASTLVPQHARFADLCVLGQDSSATALETGYTFSEQLLFVTGRPVVFIPAQRTFDALGGHLLIAWNSSRASARAVNDALPLIERADRVTLLAVNPADFAARYGALPPQQIVEHLRRHGATVEGIWREDVPSGSIADVVQAEAHRVGADLIVAGAFGHPRLWEKMMGGVTRDLLARMDLPVLMSY